jgi:myo-inositol-1(or 4)-monophosphatase
MTQPFVRYAAELVVARRAAAAAAALFVGREGIRQVREKAPADLVTEIDEAAERAIIACIRSTFPDDAIIAEESAAGALSPRRSWIIDPIDGTVNFVHGHPFTCVSIAFADEQGVAVGVIHAPFLRESFHAIRGGGAWCNDQPIRVSATAVARDALLATGFPFKPGKGDPDAYLRLVGDMLRTTRGVRRAGSAALDLAYVAAGRIDAFFELGLSPWDIAAGALLVQEAGGTVGGWPGDADADPLQTGNVLASNGVLHEWLVGTAARRAAELGLGP